MPKTRLDMLKDAVTHFHKAGKEIGRLRWHEKGAYVMEEKKTPPYTYGQYKLDLINRRAIEYANKAFGKEVVRITESTMTPGWGTLTSYKEDLSKWWEVAEQYGYRNIWYNEQTISEEQVQESWQRYMATDRILSITGRTASGNESNRIRR